VPFFEGLIMDAKGALYGTTQDCGHRGGGVVFKLTPPTYAETVLHNFASGGPKLVNGDFPDAGLIMDATGALYGTTTQGGAGQGGVVFKVQ
jgi:uncharacterized repeat protein (TIGR03803 family)